MATKSQKAPETENDEVLDGELLPLDPTKSAVMVAGKPIPPAELFKPQGTEALMVEIETKVRSHIPDVTTADGRAAIARRAREVSSAKTFVDNLRDGEVRHLKAVTSAIDAEGKRFRDRMDALRDETKKPVKDWQEIEDKRIDAHMAVINKFAQAVVLSGTESSLTLKDLLFRTQHDYDDHKNWEEFADLGKQALDAALQTLNNALNRTMEKEDQDRELEQLRTEKAQRQKEDDARKAVEEAAQKVMDDIAAQKAKDDAAKLKRENDRKHRDKIHQAIVSDLVATGITKDQAVMICGYMADGKVRHVAITY